jgi:hypothetical protein
MSSITPLAMIIQTQLGTKLGREVVGCEVGALSVWKQKVALQSLGIGSMVITCQK